MPAPLRWRIRNAYALAQFMSGTPAPYDSAFWNVHQGGDWNGLARLILELGAPRSIVDVGCGTGALTETIIAHCGPVRVLAVDPSPAFVAHVAAHVEDPRAAVREGDAQHLPVADGSVDVVVSGLVLNFVPHPEAALAEMTRATQPGGSVAAYVWDYAGDMQMLRLFWDAAVDGDPAAAALDEGRLFASCRPEPLAALFDGAGLQDVQVTAIDVVTPFADFDDFWRPFLAGVGPAPAYVTSLDDVARAGLRERLRARLPADVDGSIRLNARAWAVRGRVS
jgi:SAM-dependent methyltransferase